MVFTRTEEGKTVITNRVQRGGGRGYKTLTASEGDH